MFETKSFNLIDEIKKREGEILKKWELKVTYRGLDLVDIWVSGDGDWYPAGCYNLKKKLFTLFYNKYRGDTLRKYIEIKSDNFFDELDEVVRILYYDV